MGYTGQYILFAYFLLNCLFPMKLKTKREQPI